MDEAVSGLVTCTVSSTRTGTNRVILASGSSQLAHFIGPADDLTAIFSGYTPGSNVISFPGNSASKLVLAPQLNKENFQLSFIHQIETVFVENCKISQIMTS